ncbi:hypothetical protein [Magnetospirillum sp. XM-1]|uniref:hypothetical protein n=1 Tax=Magnetospirillum sp. XM-1 TaxID=1663591 RepID=UPI000838DD7E|nr:hypothetical protein [Magnetospirillum sp. XM-1]
MGSAAHPAKPGAPDFRIDGLEVFIRHAGRAGKEGCCVGFAVEGPDGLCRARAAASEPGPLFHALLGSFAEVRGGRIAKPFMPASESALHEAFRSHGLVPLEMSPPAGAGGGAAPCWVSAEELLAAEFSPEKAKRRRMKRWFSLLPCPHGHVGWRYVKGNGCCECRAPSHSEPGDEHHLRSLVANARARAQAKGIPFSLTVEDVARIWPADGRCPVLGMRFRRSLGSQGHGHDSATLDRLDPSKGYVPGNLLIVSARANCLRSDASAAELLRVGEFYAELLG